MRCDGNHRAAPRRRATVRLRASERSTSRSVHDAQGFFPVWPEPRRIQSVPLTFDGRSAWRQATSAIGPLRLRISREAGHVALARATRLRWWRRSERPRERRRSLGEDQSATTMTRMSARLRR